MKKWSEEDKWGEWITGIGAILFCIGEILVGLNEQWSSLSVILFGVLGIIAIFLLVVGIIVIVSKR